MTVPSFRLISWQQEVLAADTNWYEKSNRPWIYEFSNGRRFVRPLPVYPALTIDYDQGDSYDAGWVYAD